MWIFRRENRWRHSRYNSRFRGEVHPLQGMVLEASILVYTLNNLFCILINEFVLHSGHFVLLSLISLFTLCDQIDSHAVISVFDIFLVLF